mmetsp:Transcript_39083/g.67035  ORF Transcript_39083/g.67035 Transcript_39083/m.67035 type:complete len:202 (+) Transcript_39083:459-1064(+)
MPRGPASLARTRGRRSQTCPPSRWASPMRSPRATALAERASRSLPTRPTPSLPMQTGSTTPSESRAVDYSSAAAQCVGRFALASDGGRLEAPSAVKARAPWHSRGRGMPKSSLSRSSPRQRRQRCRPKRRGCQRRPHGSHGTEGARTRSSTGRHLPRGSPCRRCRRCRVWQKHRARRVQRRNASMPTGAPRARSLPCSKLF